jgi:hypothetical protein
MRATILSGGMTASQAIFFTIVVGALGGTLAPSVRAGADAIGLPASLSGSLADVPPVSAIMSALLGYDPVAHMATASELGALPAAVVARVGDPHFFAGLLAEPFVEGIRVTLVVSAALCVLAALASALRGRLEAREGDALRPSGAVVEEAATLAQAD